ncbi:hypothetical protein VAT7223_01961 [Vibrio atlanticus]|uniref:Sel1 repeat family protein n=2 Tax=Vibrio atlanticus TaxID=693153 RepID=A0A1C3IR92_9VIBR|nr:hypothetical protein VAT7223_01961 [Vibrio atlanticus]
MLVFLLALFISSQVFADGDISWVNAQNKYSCAKELENCFMDDFTSEEDSKVVDGIFLYLDNIDYLSHYYSKTKFLERLAVISKKNENYAFLIEASIYYHGDGFVQDLDKSIDIIESSPFYSENDPDQMIILGKSYYWKFTKSKEPPLDWHIKAKKYLKKSYKLDENYASRELAFILIEDENSEDLELAGDLFRRFAETGDEDDVYTYELYIQSMKQLKDNQ